MPFAELSTGARLYYDDLGSGDPVIAIHGWLGTAQVDLANVLDWLSQSYRVLGPSLRGYGDSTPKPRDFPPDFYHRDAREVIAFMDALGIDKAHLLGYSDGGETALCAAGFAPERFRSVAVWGAVGYFGAEMRPVAQANYPATWMDDATKQLHGITDADAMVLQWVRALTHMIDRGGDVSLSLAPKISAPTLLMLGERDRLNPQAYGQKLVDALPNGRLEMFKTGHAIHQEDWTAFQQVVGAFLEGA
jgi:valacyclovir hydrolase